MTEYILIYTLCASGKEAKKIGKLLLENRLAACVNIFPAVQSMYWWEGKIQNAKEVGLFVKTHSSKFEAIKSEILKNHSYECPCVVSLPVQEGEESYLKWIGKEIR